METNIHGVTTEPFKPYKIRCVKPKEAGPNWLGTEVLEPTIAYRTRNAWHDKRGCLVSYDQFVTEAIPMDVCPTCLAAVEKSPYYGPCNECAEEHEKGWNL